MYAYHEGRAPIEVSDRSAKEPARLSPFNSMLSFMMTQYDLMQSGKPMKTGMSKEKAVIQLSEMKSHRKKDASTSQMSSMQQLSQNIIRQGKSLCPSRIGPGIKDVRKMKGKANSLLSIRAVTSAQSRQILNPIEEGPETLRAYPLEDPGQLATVFQNQTLKKRGEAGREIQIRTQKRRKDPPVVLQPKTQNPQIEAVPAAVESTDYGSIILQEKLVFPKTKKQQQHFHHAKQALLRLQSEAEGLPEINSYSIGEPKYTIQSSIRNRKYLTLTREQVQQHMLHRLGGVPKELSRQRITSASSRQAAPSLPLSSNPLQENSSRNDGLGSRFVTEQPPEYSNHLQFVGAQQEPSEDSLKPAASLSPLAEKRIHMIDSIEKIKHVQPSAKVTKFNISDIDESAAGDSANEDSSRKKEVTPKPWVDQSDRSQMTLTRFNKQQSDSRKGHRFPQEPEGQSGSDQALGVNEVIPEVTTDAGKSKKPKTKVYSFNKFKVSARQLQKYIGIQESSYMPQSDVEITRKPFSKYGAKLKYGLLVDSKKSRDLYNNSKFVEAELEKIDSKLYSSFYTTKRRNDSLKDLSESSSTRILKGLFSKPDQESKEDLAHLPAIGSQQSGLNIQEEEVVFDSIPTDAGLQSRKVESPNPKMVSQQSQTGSGQSSANPALGGYIQKKSKMLQAQRAIKRQVEENGKRSQSHLEQPKEGFEATLQSRADLSDSGSITNLSSPSKRSDSRGRLHNKVGSLSKGIQRINQQSSDYLQDEDYRLVKSLSVNTANEQKGLIRIQTMPQALVTKQDFQGGIKNKNYFTYLKAMSRFQKYHKKAIAHFDKQRAASSQKSAADLTEVILLNYHDGRDFYQSFSSGELKEFTGNPTSEGQQLFTHIVDREIAEPDILHAPSLKVRLNPVRGAPSLKSLSRINNPSYGQLPDGSDQISEPQPMKPILQDFNSVSMMSSFDRTDLEANFGLLGQPTFQNQLGPPQPLTLSNLERTRSDSSAKMAQQPHRIHKMKNQNMSLVNSGRANFSLVPSGGNRNLMSISPIIGQQIQRQKPRSRPRHVEIKSRINVRMNNNQEEVREMNIQETIEEQTPIIQTLVSRPSRPIEVKKAGSTRNLSPGRKQTSLVVNADLHALMPDGI